MPVIDNTTVASDIEHALDVQMAANFNQEYDMLADVLGIVSPEVVAAGTAMYQYEVTGALNDAEVAEGDEVPLSKYSVKKVPIGEIEMKPYRKLTTAQAVLKSGYVNSVVRTDAAMVKDVRADIIAKFFKFLASGTGTATGATLQAVLAQADAALDAEMEGNGDKAGRVVHFVNRFDIADYLAAANITTQTVFGMAYLKSFLGVNDIFATVKVPKGTVYVTPADNIHMYGVDFGALSQAGLNYTVYEGSLIGVNHQPAYNRVSAETNVLTGASLLAEITNYIVKATIAPSA
ncbi:hypothetical protein FIC87_12655 [Eggerthella lenta]|uniref:Phage capsid protein n=1 Tax=Eggerthella lenta TaxID=84112 RepID=A0A5C5BRW2_EGGLN|nr:hypothetical protein [Eggerthella lenta]TNU89044.1 hypothetical protein FIC87_12655 [Eggerthella lenta]